MKSLAPWLYSDIKKVTLYAATAQRICDLQAAWIAEWTLRVKNLPRATYFLLD